MPAKKGTRICLTELGKSLDQYERSFTVCCERGTDVIHCKGRSNKNLGLLFFYYSVWERKH